MNGIQIELRDINTNILEGRLLMSALSRLTVKVDTNKTPDECLRQVLEVANLMYKDSPPINKTAEAVKQLINELIEDKEYFMSWVDNIAMAFKDEYHKGISKQDLHIHEIANKAAHRFLNILIHEELQKFPMKVFLKHNNGELEELNGHQLNRERPYEFAKGGRCMSSEINQCNYHPDNGVRNPL